MKVETSAVLCPQCGAPLNGTPRDGIIICQYCSTPIRVTNYSDSVSDDGKTVIRDVNTGMEICRAEIPQGWTTMGSFVSTLQSAAFPAVVLVRAASQDGKCEISYKSGECYNSIIDTPTHRHNEGAFDGQLLMPYKRFNTVDDFCKAVFTQQCADAANVRELAKDDIPYGSETGKQDYAKLRTDMIRAIQTQFARNNSMNPVRYQLNNVYYDGGIRVYGYEKNGSEYIYAVATVISATDYTTAALTGFFADTAHYIGWEAAYTVTMSAPVSGHQKCYNAFKRFIVTSKASNDCNSAFDRAKANAQSTIRNNLAEYSRSWQQYNRQLMQKNEANWQRVQQRLQQNSADIWNIRESTAAGISGTNSRVAEMQSEAIKGVNSYSRADGSTVEYSVMSERVYGYGGDPQTTFGVDSSAFEPGADFTELKRRF